MCVCLADRRVRGRRARRETTGVPPTTGPPLGFPSGPPIALGSSYHSPLQKGARRGAVRSPLRCGGRIPGAFRGRDTPPRKLLRSWADRSAVRHHRRPLAKCDSTALQALRLVRPSEAYSASYTYNRTHLGKVCLAWYGYYFQAWSGSAKVSCDQ